MHKVLFSSASDHWVSPKDIYNYYKKLCWYDPCPLHASFDGLSIDWGYMSYVNPPYSNIGAWVDKSIEEAKKGKTIVLLVPARTDTKWFHKLVRCASDIMFIVGRLKFGNATSSAPFPSCLVCLRHTAYGRLTVVWRPRDNLCLERWL